MGYKRTIRRLIKDVTGAHLYKSLPRGMDVFDDIRHFLPNLDMSRIFDVGANAGQSAKDFSRHFPKSQIYCFEPIAITYLRLQHELKDHATIRTFKLALGAEEGPRQMVLQGRSEMFHLQRSDEDIAGQGEDIRLEQVALRTVDEFCRTHGIDHIDFLKIDTEGHDLDVLKGAQTLLAGQHIDVIQVESGMNSRNRRHVPFDAFTAFLEPRGYYLFGIYEQTNEWLIGAPNLRRTNPVFISERVIKANTPS